jgi:hypothetical protein
MKRGKRKAKTRKKLLTFSDESSSGASVVIGIRHSRIVMARAHFSWIAASHRQ